MISGDTHRLQLHRKPIIKLRAARQQTILRRMFSRVPVDGAGEAANSSHRSQKSMRHRYDGKELWTVNEDDSNRSAWSSKPSVSSSSDQHSEDENPVARSAVHDDVFIDGGEIKRSTAAAAHGLISLMGRRREMEDAVTAVPTLAQTLSAAPPHGFFAVYDGHGGFGVAERCKARLHYLVAEELAGVNGGRRARDDVDWERVMKMSFARMDREVCAEDGEVAGGELRRVQGNTTGSTAVVAVVGAEEIVVANCGDSRAVLCRDGAAIPLSRDHKPERPDERERVEAAGGSIIDYHGPRILGVLATSRSIGDHSMRPYVISVPEVTLYRRTQSDKFLILASDGLWDVVSNDMACELVKKCLLSELYRRRKVFSEEDNCDEGYATVVATMLAEMAISKGSKDNVSVIVVMLS